MKVSGEMAGGRRGPGDPAGYACPVSASGGHVAEGTPPAPAANGELPARDEAEALAETFRVLADPGRVRVILALLGGGETNVGGLAAAAGLSETACSHALRLLRHAHVVQRRKVGRSVLYSLDDDHVSDLLRLAREHLDHAGGR
jgi:DNA-binding transcriptional ArsR family regulator